MIGLQLLIFAILAILASEANVIDKIEIKTANCDDCGMSNFLGALRMQVA